MVCYVRIVHIGPESYRFRKILPHALVFPDTFLTLVYKRSKAVLFYLLLAVETKEFFNLKFNRKTVSIPSCLTWNIIPLHSTVPWYHVFDNTGKNMSDMRLAVCSRRSVIEHVSIAALAIFHTLFKYIVIRPELFNFFLSVDEAQIR